MSEGAGPHLGQRVVLLLAAAVAGAAGLGLESVLISTAGLSVGFARAGALGLGAFVAGWAGGAWLAGHHRGRPGPALFGVGCAVAGLAAGMPQILLRAGSSPLGDLSASILALSVVALCAAPQGAFLPLLARARGDRDVSALFACNLAGSVVGVLGIGFLAVAELGRPGAAFLAGVAALAAGVLGAAGSRGAGTPDPEPAAQRASWPAGRVLALATFWTIGLEWICLRLGVLWIDSEQLTLAAVLAAGLVALACGAALLPRLVHRDERGVFELLALQLALSLWPLFAAPVLRWMQEAGMEDGWVILLLVGPTVFALGGLVPVLYRTLPGEGGARLGSLLGYEAWGALAAGPLLHWWAVPSFGLGGSIGLLCLVGGAAGLVLLGRARRLSLATLLAGIGFGVAAFTLPEPALSTPKLVDPALEVLSFTEDGEFAVTVVDDGLLGERTLLTDRFRAAGTGRDYMYMRVLGHLPLLMHPSPRRAAVVALGTGTTVGSASLHAGLTELDVLEISPAVVEAAPWFEEVHRGALELPHVRVLVGDGRRTLAGRPGHYDVITIEPLLPDSPFGVYLYTDGFYATARRALAPGGLVCQWVPPHALEPEVFDAVVEAFVDSFEWSSVWLFGTQVILLGGEARPDLDPGVFPTQGESPVLQQALAGLGLEGAPALAARFVCTGEAWPEGPRALTDADPWISYRRKGRGAAVLTWLPVNLDRVLGLRREPPSAWTEGFSPQDVQRLLGVRALHEARMVHARNERDLVSGVRTPREADMALMPSVVQASGAAGQDEEVRVFLDDLKFLRALREGVSALAAGKAEEAAMKLVSAVELRGERADTHLYLAVALQRLGVADGSRAARQKALELCPRLAETSAGKRALALGLSMPRE